MEETGVKVICGVQTTLTAKDRWRWSSNLLLYQILAQSFTAVSLPHAVIYCCIFALCSHLLLCLFHMQLATALSFPHAAISCCIFPSLQSAYAAFFPHAVIYRLFPLCSHLLLISLAQSSTAVSFLHVLIYCFRASSDTVCASLTH